MSRPPAPPCACGRPAYARGLCRAHYVRERRLELGSELRLSLPQGTRDALARVARAAGVPIAALAVAWLAERASTEAVTGANREADYALRTT